MLRSSLCLGFLLLVQLIWRLPNTASGYATLLNSLWNFDLRLICILTMVGIPSGLDHRCCTFVLCRRRKGMLRSSLCLGFLLLLLLRWRLPNTASGYDIILSTLWSVDLRLICILPMVGLPSPC